MNKVFGIDVSEFQGNFDFKTAKDEGVRFAMIRAGYTGSSNGIDKSVDPKFEEYYKNAKEANIDVGAYWFSRATSYELGKLEAEFMYKHCLKEKRFEYPIAIDVEDNIYQKEAGKKAVTDAIKGFCEYLEEKGYYVIVYASVNWFENYIDTSELTRYDKWVASWGVERPTYPTNGMWQFSDGSNERNRPIAGHDVDHDYAYKNYPMIMRNNGLNGYTRNICN